MEALPDIGLSNARGIISLGNLKNSTTGDNNPTINSIRPELLKAPTARKIPTKVGNNLNTISIPSLAPSKKVSKTLFFSFKP